ncbi:MAG: cell division protein FtsZ [Hydrogenophilales bacterium CG17_big_fil_post_rev_8_21_14_2_50_63_12]|nr:MAG: cell division protein FtsZ [Hydrogenophilales bacterium CG17_big_fil_post_rev_8_21_14_2_50_63_12]PIX96273.1 MAG: cell division protein FtsZ [Hydrogenophilales bacterium CG_4_10_14_3_um_filter_63_21]PJB02001.1 MAG: cell division protein FtsZ [Hydrogenophilales bacterium CG_4_9_14_3_um_filter_63_34]
MFELEDLNTQEAVIKVIGVGGCGGNAVDHMIGRGMAGVEFITINTDAQALRRNRAPVQLQIGNSATKGLGAGGKWEVGKEAALEDKERIAALIDGADMLFIAAGMGGGTGTGAAPVVAEVAKDLGILAVAVVTKPFVFEQNKRMRSAEQGLKALSEHVDSLIVIPNEKLIQVLGGGTKLTEAFIAANEVLHSAVSGIAEIISHPGMINVDFADVKTVMSEVGMAMMGSALAEGEDRARVAAEQAVASPLLENVDLKGARGVLVNITSNDSLTLDEYYEVMNTIQGFAAEEATVIVGTALDDTMGDGLRVTMVATGLGNPVKATRKPEIRIVEPMVMQATGTDNPRPFSNPYESDIDTPTVIRNRRSSQAAVEVAQSAGIDKLDIPAFLRKQAD